MRVEHEGGTAAWLAGTLAAPSVQGHRLPPLQELWPYQSLFSKPLVAGDKKASLASLPLQPRLFRHLRTPLPGVLLFCLVHQAHGGPPLAEVLLCISACQVLKGGPGVGSYPVVQCVRHLMGQPLYYSAADAGMQGEGGYGDGSTLYV